MQVSRRSLRASSGVWGLGGWARFVRLLLVSFIGEVKKGPGPERLSCFDDHTGSTARVRRADVSGYKEEYEYKSRCDEEVYIMYGYEECEY